MKPNGPAMVATVITAVITFGRSSAGVRMVRMPMIGALTSGVKNANAPMMPASRRATGCVGESRKSGSGMATIATAASFSSGTFCVSLLSDDRPGERADPEAGEEEAEHVRVRVDSGSTRRPGRRG